jgi:flagellar export protein FliJ
MAKFRFKLEPLLTARRMEERTEQRAVAVIEREAALRLRQTQLAEAKQVLRGQLTGTLDAHDLRMYASTALQHVRHAQRTVVELAGIHRRLEEARTRLAEAASRRRALELLKERRWQQWKTRLDKAEAAQLDDLAVANAARKFREDTS